MHKCNAVQCACANVNRGRTTYVTFCHKCQNVTDNFSIQDLLLTLNWWALQAFKESPTAIFGHDCFFAISQTHACVFAGILWLINCCTNMLWHKNVQISLFYSKGPLLSENISCSGGLGNCFAKNEDLYMCAKMKEIALQLNWLR